MENLRTAHKERFNKKLFELEIKLNDFRFSDNKIKHLIKEVKTVKISEKKRK